MRILPKPVAFLWDKGNLEKNLIKHSVTVQEAEELFSNEPFTLAVDAIHSFEGEKRFQALGKTKAGRKLFTAFTIRENKVRVISVRDMKRKEREVYERLEANT